MAYEILDTVVSVIASADLSGSQYCGVALDVNGQATLPAAGGLVIGICQNKPIVGRVTTVALDGVSKMVASAAIAAGSKVSVTATGQAVVAAAGNQVVGIAVEAASGAGAVFPCLISQSGTA